MLIKCDRIYFEDGVRDGYLVVDGKKITGFLDASANVTDYVDYTGYRVIPGVFDTHNHGTHGYTPNGLVGGKDEVRKYLKGLASNGVSNVFATMSYLEGTDNYKRIGEIMNEECDGATILGIHSEDTNRLGHRVGEKGIPLAEAPLNMQLVKDTWENSNGLLKLCGIAPELENADEAIEYLNSKGVKVAFMHSEANFQQAMEAFKKGIYVSTHTCNVMRGIHHRNMGGLGACLLDENLYNEIICDGMHVSLEMLQLIFRTKPDMSKWLMISDNVQVSGAPVGQYRNLDNPRSRFVTEEGFCLEDTGRLSGSTQPVIFGMKNLVEKLGMPIETVIKMAALNPAVAYGFDKEKGSIKLGKDADLAVLDDDYKCVATYANGRKVFDREVDKDLFNQEYIDKFRVAD